ncbi:AMP-binding protein, partial [Campylobacter molothri]|uniref:AMP-binding protein n=1 Tax=Campylobacter molothri TaxID=1032242 RepID=UPI00301DD387
MSFFGVALSGNFYTLLDEKSPKERIEKVIEVLKPKLLITSKDLNLDLNLPTLYTQDFKSFNIDENLITKAKEKHIDTNLLYVLFTSGSTGIPKGVSIAHKSVIDYTLKICEILEINFKNSLLNQTPFYFSASARDIFSSVKVGATLHIIPNHIFAFPNEIFSYIEQEKITTISWIPSVLTHLCKGNALEKFRLNSLRTIAWVGEIMPTKTLNIWKNHLKKTKFINLYGPTEIAGT